MKTRLICMVSAGLLLTACANTENTGTGASGPTLPEITEPTENEEAAPSPTEEPADPARPPTNDRGNVGLTIGQEFAITSTVTGTPVLTFAVDSISPAQCTPDWEEYGSDPVNGNIIAVQMRMATSPDYAQSPAAGYFTLTPYDFAFIGPDGVTVDSVDTPATYGCVDQTQQFTSNPLSPASQYRGTVVLDVPAPNGTLIYRPSPLDYGFEWEF